ncbi:MAG: zinc-binding dehydrogenase [Chloroflexi bacterium]|nr:zinc-binding dehydrogenase [Chloroflexota bacterium]
MKGLVFLGDRKVQVVDLSRPAPGPQEVVIEMKASGLCGSGSDLRPYRTPGGQLTEQQRSFARGHEPCGVVVELGPQARNVKVGDRVMVHHYRGCGACKHCLAGWPQLCLHGFQGYGLNLPGGHADYMVCVDTACVPMPDALTYEEGACCSCGAGTAYQALKRLAPSGMDTITIFGQGFVGVSAAMLARAMGARVIAVDVVPERLEMARQLGADEIIDASAVDPVAAIKELTRGEGADAGLDCSGAEAAQNNMIASTRTWGRVGFVGVGTNPRLDILQITRKHLTMHGSWTFGTRELAELASFVVDRRVPLGDTITHRFPLSQAEEAYRLLDAGKTGKIVLVWDR